MTREEAIKYLLFEKKVMEIRVGKEKRLDKPTIKLIDVAVKELRK